MAKLQRGEVEGGDHEKLRKGIAARYDESTEVWEEFFGEYIHRGFYDASAAAPGAAPLTAQDHRRAQLRMIEEALAFAAVSGLYIRLNSKSIFWIVWYIQESSEIWYSANPESFSTRLTFGTDIYSASLFSVFTKK